MGEVTHIAWCHHTFSPWEGCVKVSQECDHCYAADRDAHYHGAENWGKDALRLYHVDAYWRQLRKWNKAAELAGEHRRVFEGSLCDVMEDRPDLVEPRHRLFDEVDATPWLDHLMLTKRPQNFRKFLPAAWLLDPRPNVWMGTTCGVNKSAWRIAELRNTPAVVRFLSIEPLLEYIPNLAAHLTGIHWCIFGGESGAHARPMDVDWVRDGVAACRAVGVAPFVKQLGACPFDSSLTASGRIESLKLNQRAGSDWDEAEWPQELRVREFPQAGA